MIKTLLPNGQIHYSYALGEGPVKKKQDSFPEIEKIYYSAKEVSDILKESQSCIRLWNDQILQNHERRHGRRVYTSAIIAKLHIVKNLLRIEKYTILGAIEKLKQK